MNTEERPYNFPISLEQFEEAYKQTEMGVRAVEWGNSSWNTSCCPQGAMVRLKLNRKKGKCWGDAGDNLCTLTKIGELLGLTKAQVYSFMSGFDGHKSGVHEARNKADAFHAGQAARKRFLCPGSTTTEAGPPVVTQG